MRSAGSTGTPRPRVEGPVPVRPRARRQRSSERVPSVPRAPQAHSAARGRRVRELRLSPALTLRSRRLFSYPPYARRSTPTSPHSGRARRSIGTLEDCASSAAQMRIEDHGAPHHLIDGNSRRPNYRTPNNFFSIDPALSPPAPPVAPCSALANKRERGRVALRNYRTLYFLMPSPLGEKPTFSFQSPEVVSTAENAPCSAQPNAR